MLFKGLVQTFTYPNDFTYAPSGASSLLGTSFLIGNLVQLGSHGIALAVRLPVRKSLTCVRRLLALDPWSVMLIVDKNRQL